MTKYDHYEVLSNLNLTTCTPEMHAKTCNYWYLVQMSHMAYMAFTHRTSLLRWLEERGLTLTDELAAHGTYSNNRIIGQFREVMHWDTDEFEELLSKAVVVTRKVSNGEYTKAAITENEGIRTVHILNPNVKSRVVYDLEESLNLVG